MSNKTKRIMEKENKIRGYSNNLLLFTVVKSLNKYLIDLTVPLLAVQ